MRFADDIVIWSESRGQVEENPERWMYALERRAMEISISKTEYFGINEREPGEMVEMMKVDEYLWSTIQSHPIP